MRIEPFAALCWGTRAYTETVDPARRPGIPQQRYWRGTVRQGSVTVG